MSSEEGIISPRQPGKQEGRQLRPDDREAEGWHQEGGQGVHGGKLRGDRGQNNCNRQLFIILASLFIYFK